MNKSIAFKIIKLLISKDECWAYENEGRVISKTHGLIDIEKSALQKFYFGLRTLESDRNLIRKILDQNEYNTAICEMVRSENDFGLIVNEV